MGWVYIFINAAVPGHVKVGFTDRDPGQRARELATTGLPGTYSIEYAVEVDDPRSVEREVHRLLGDAHYHKEWFSCSLSSARNAFDAALYGVRYNVWDGSASPQPVTCSPLVAGHPLERYFDGRQMYPDGLPQARLSLGAPNVPLSPRPMSSGAGYECRSCGHVNAEPPRHLSYCRNCGLTERVL